MLRPNLDVASRGLHIVNPLDHPDWDSLLVAGEDDSFFHSSAWARVLVESYRYKPAYFAAFAEGRLSFLMPFMEVDSRLTGKRAVSLPFTDQCRPHERIEGLFPEAVQIAIDRGRKEGWRYIDWRDARGFDEGATPSTEFLSHEISLSGSEQRLFANLGASNKRGIKRALKEGLSVTVDRSLDSLTSFYRLNGLTRKRHGLPPQPLLFFKKIFDHVLCRDLGTIVSAFYSGERIAAAVFFHFGARAIYKYSASDRAYQRLRPNNLVLWEALRWYREKGLESMNLGRTAPDHEGLLRFKRLWGGQESAVRYYRYDLRRSAFVRHSFEMSPIIKKVFTHIPIPISRLAGRWLSRHMG